MSVSLKGRIKFLAFYLTLAFFLGLGPVVFAQQATIQLGKNRLPITEYFTISVKLRNLPLQTISDFPEIEGFKKSSRNRTTAQIGLGDKTIIEQTIIQNYAAYQEGKFPLKPFSVLINGKNISSRGTIITVEPMATPAKPTLPTEPELPVEPPVALQPFDTQSFLSVETDKKEIFVGEGLYLRLAFYLAEGEQEQLDFYNFGQQFPELVRQLRQRDAWEEIIETQPEVLPDTVTIGNKIFLKYNLYRRVFYPLNTNPLEFRAVTLKMSRRAAAETYATNTDSDEPIQLVAFTSQEKNISVKALPPHPLRETVPVGQYQLQEALDRTTFKTGQSFTYRFNVVGEGNLGALNPPVLPPVTGLDIYPPDLRLIKNKAPGTIKGTKSFRYVMLAKSAGDYPLGKIFRFIYFNLGTEKYDTLHSKLILQVKGVEKGLAGTEPENVDPFYKLIREEDNKLVDLNQFTQIKFYTNVVILFLICGSLFLFYKKK